MRSSLSPVGCELSLFSVLILHHWCCVSILLQVSESKASFYFEVRSHDSHVISSCGMPVVAMAPCLGRLDPAAEPWL